MPEFLFKVCVSARLLLLGCLFGEDSFFGFFICIFFFRFFILLLVLARFLLMCCLFWEGDLVGFYFLFGF